MENYLKIRESLRTFDVIITEHKRFFWRLVGHTAGVYRDPLTHMLMVYESTTQNRINGISGVQLTPMGIWMQYYPGKVFIRRMVISEAYCRAAKTRKYLAAEHIVKYRGTSYPDLSTRRGRWILINAALDLPFRIGQNPDIDDVMFCTQLYIDWLEYCGLMNVVKMHENQMFPSEFEPDDMREGGKIEEYLAEGVSLGEEVWIK